MKKFLSAVLVVSFMLTQVVLALAAETLHCRINDKSVTAINTSLPGVQTSGNTTYYVGMGEVLSYDTHESKANGSSPGLYKDLQSGESGWVRSSNDTRPVFYKQNSDTSALFQLTASNAQIAHYTFNKDFGFSGDFSLEYKVKSDAAATVDLRLISTASNNAGWNNAYQIVYSFLKFSPDKFTYQNAVRKPDNTGDNVSSHTVNGLGLNEWITLRFDINTEEKSYDVYANGSCIGEKLSFHYCDLPEGTLTVQQKASNDLGFMRIREAKTSANVEFDDIAIFNTASETNNYFSEITSHPEYTTYIGETLTDVKIPVSITDANGVSTGKTAYVPVRLSDADTSLFGVQKVSIDGYSNKATVYVNKKTKSYSNDFESYTITDTSAGVPLGTVTGHTVQQEKLKDGSINQYMQIYKSADWTSLYPIQALNAAEIDFDVQFNVRFPSIDGFEEQAKFLSVQLNNGIKNIVTLNIEPEYGETTSGTRKRLRVTLPKSDEDSFAGKATYSVWAPSETDWSQWHTIKMSFADKKMCLEFDDNILTENKTGAQWEQIRTDIDFNVLKIAHRQDAAEIEAISNFDNICITSYPTVKALSDISYTTSLSDITVPEKVTASLTDSTSVNLPISAITPINGSPALDAITECGTYTYSISADGSEKEATLTLTVIDKAYSLGTPYTDENTGKTVIPVHKATNDTASVNLITALYKNDTLKDISVIPVSGSGNILTPITITDGAVVKAFLWNSLALLTPACEEVTAVLPAATPEAMENYDIVCWGDSLTYGHIDGAEPPTLYSYPTVLSELTGKNIKNMGIGGETATTIAVRQGGLTLAPSGSFTLGSAAGSSVTFTEGSFNDLTGGSVVPRSKSGYFYGWEGTCYLNGIPGTITKLDVDESVTPRKLKSLTFTRTSDGEALTVSENEQRVLIPNGNFIKGDINVIFVGQNGWHDVDNDGDIDEHDLIAIIDKMISACPDKDKTLIIGLTTGSSESRKALETAMEAAYGMRYINMRAHLSSVDTLISAGITPTESDLEKITTGEMPTSLWRSSSDYVHMNATGYNIVAHRVYQAMLDLGYIN